MTVRQCLGKKSAICAGLLALAACIFACGSKASEAPATPGKDLVTTPPAPTFTLFALAEVRGQIGPCGCTSDPLGDLARTAQLIADARRRGPVLVVDAGSLLYAKGSSSPAADAQERKKAELLALAYREDLKVAAVGLGPADLLFGPAGVTLPRQVANLSAPPGLALEAPKVVDVGGVKVGIFGVVDRDALADLALTDPIAAGTAAVAALRKQGAQMIVGLVQATTKKNALLLAKSIRGIDFVVAGLGAMAPEPDAVAPEAESLADGSYLIVPGNRGQVVSQVQVFVPNGAQASAFVDAIGPGAANAKLAQLTRQRDGLQAELETFATDPTADKAFVAQKRSEATALANQIAMLKDAPWRIPPAPQRFFALAQVRIAKALGCDANVQTKMAAFYQAVGEANVAFALKSPPPPPPKRGAATYVGGAACEDCHAEAVAFWQTTRHAHAWQTLVERNQQFDLDCIGCHVTGWDKPTGASLRSNEKLRDVQCETCHAPASIHVAKGGEEKPKTLLMEVTADFCATSCHTKEHSDTFEFKAYLRDVVGPGHGAAFRANLGEGPTGKQLRAAALAKAGKTLGPGCKK